jgi:hypothetical protein
MNAEEQQFTGRMINWKFDQALARIPPSLSTEDREIVAALAATFGDCGWFSGSIGVIVGAAIASVRIEPLP